MSGVRQKNIVVFGGSFDPFHNGHLAVINRVHAVVRPDLLLVAPAGKPPFKGALLTASIKQRLAMVGLAVQGIPKTELCNLDANTDEMSYTINLIDKLREKYGQNSQLSIVVGYDVLNDFGSWYRTLDIIQKVSIIAVSREAGAKIPAQIAKLYKNLRITDIDYSGVSVSSSELKKAGAKSDLFAKNVPAKVATYLSSQNLYER